VTHILVPTSSVSTSTQGYSLGSVTTKASINAQTLVVQPLQQTNVPVDKGPVPIQPKTTQGHRLPVQMPPRHPTAILPALPTHSQATPVGHHPPHIPVQLVGARPGSAGNTQALAVAQNRGNTAPENTTGGTTHSGAVAMVTFFTFVYPLGALVKGRTALRGTRSYNVYCLLLLDKACRRLLEKEV
jgi:polyhomeotic-like protein 1